jgi:hypothetical protein
MADYTRRTHVVRIPKDEKDPDNNYIDVEVLDAVAFKGPMGEDLVLNFKQENVSVWCDDDTGGGNERHEGQPTRRSHMERKRGPNGMMLDVEVLDAIAFKNKMGEEYILNLPSSKSSKHSTNDTSDGGANTRRTHTEKISDGFKKDAKEFTKIVRTDQVAFRTVLGKEMVIKMPSGDDPNQSEPERANTYIWSPRGYDPTNDKGPKPPLNKDKNIYVSWPKNTSGPWLGDDEDARVSQGMLWWIRKIKTGGGIVILTFEYTATGSNTPGPDEPRPIVKNMLGPSKTAQYDFWNGMYLKVSDDVNQAGPAVVNPVTPDMLTGLYHWNQVPPYRKKVGQGGSDQTTTFYFAWPAGASPAPDADNYANSVPNGAPGQYGTYAGQFVWIYGIRPPAGYPSYGGPVTTNLAEQQAQAEQTTSFLANSSGDFIPGYPNFYQADGSQGSTPIDHNNPTFTVRSVEVVAAGGGGTSEVKGKAVAAFSIATLKSFIDPNDPQDEFKFQVEIPKSQDARWTLMGSAYKTDTDFPFSSTNDPQFGFGDDIVFKPRGTKKTVVEVTVHLSGEEYSVSFEVISGGTPIDEG